MSSDKLVTQEYWERYYGKTGTNKKLIQSVCGVYEEYWNVLIGDTDLKDKTLIEIGGYPGRYLAYLAHNYKVQVTCLDYNSDREKVDESMAAFEVNDYSVEQADIFNHNPNQKYDFVFSNGFIEHFENYEEVMELHLKYLKPGGRLLIMIPNKRFYKWIYQSILDRDNLKAHNLKPMKLAVFRKFAKENQLKILRLSYFGGFQFGVHRSVSGWQKFITDWHERIFGKLINPIVKKIPNRFLSNTIIAVYQSPNREPTSNAS